MLSIMRRMRLGEKIICWILKCLQSARVSIIVNGSPTTEIVMEKSLRWEGDPLFPFLFLIIGGALNQLILKVVSLDLVQGIQLKKSSTQLTHAQFSIIQSYLRREACRRSNITNQYCGLSDKCQV